MKAKTIVAIGVFIQCCNPKPRERRLKQCPSLGAINDDIFGADALLQHSLLRMLSTSAEQTGRFDLEIADLLFVAVDDTESILLL